jgi:LPXTG-motif cell wall-anchored protein
LLVSTLVLAMTAPLALAQAIAGDGQAIAGGDQATAGDDRDNGNTDITIVDCSQVQNALGSQSQYGNASAQYLSEAIAVVSQELNITQNQANACLGGQPNEGGGSDNREAGEGDDDEEENVLANTVPEVNKLPETGGASLLSLGVGLALVAGGASLIRFRR